MTSSTRSATEDRTEIEAVDVAAMRDLGNVLCVVAHPDDESLFAGLTIAALTRAELSCTVAAVSHGELRLVPFASRGPGRFLPRRLREQYCSTIEAEFTLACLRLGAIGTILGFPDLPVVSEEAQSRLVRLVSRLLDHEKPDLLLTHGSSGEYGHAMHVAVHVAVRRAIRASVGAYRTWTFGAQPPSIDAKWFNRRDQATHCVTGDGLLGAKKAAISAYRSSSDTHRRIYGDDPATKLGIEYWARMR